MIVSDKNLIAAAKKHLEKSLGSDFADFFASLDGAPKRAARINTLKAEPREIAAALSLKEESAYCGDAYIVSDETDGNHPYHKGGLFYLQEPSAMLPIEAARPVLKEIISSRTFPLMLDLCAAPGGKSGQIAALLGGKGALVSNEVDFKRAQTLAANLERLGVKNSLVTSMMPDKLETLLAGSFDAVIVDAPCSGEGMLRKESAAWNNMNEKTSLACAARQSEIIACAANCVKEGGLLVYSTCTLNETENENVIEPLIKDGGFDALECPHLTLVRKSKRFAAYRALPQDGGGEGHFVCVMQKNGASKRPPEFSLPFDKRYKNDSALKKLLSPLSDKPLGCGVYLYRDAIYACPPLPFVKGLCVVRAGVKVAEATKNMLVPDHAFVASLTKTTCKSMFDFPCESGGESARREGSAYLSAYLRGEELQIETSARGYGIVCADGYPLGLVKASGEGVKNRYPKGLRIK
ncbi:MAG: hypothetical protein HFE48_01980 [Clostridia bacterium]|nr:hypothetical protein [Clostridia bacterium]